jgi:hypothetical protein
MKCVAAVLSWTPLLRVLCLCRVLTCDSARRLRCFSLLTWALTCLGLLAQRQTNVCLSHLMIGSESKPRFVGHGFLWLPLVIVCVCVCVCVQLA